MKYTRATMTKEIAQALVDAHGTISAAARAILRQCETAGAPVSYHAVRLWISDALADRITATKKIYDDAETDKLNQIKNLLDEANIPIEAIDKIDRVRIRSGFHEVVTKDADGNPQTTRSRTKNVALVLSPKWEDGPQWPVVQAAKPTIVKYAAPTIIVPRGLRIEVVHPDTQIGYQRVLDSRKFNGKSETYELQTIHDEDAIDVALQITAAVQPDGATHLGDLIDGSEFSKYLQVEEFWRTSQASIDYAHTYLAKLKSACGPSRKRRGQKKTTPKKFRLVDGNHDWKRLATYIQQNARAAFGLRPANATPDHWPDLSLPHLLRLDELGFEQCGMWPGSEAWLVEGKHALVVVHDPRKRNAYQASVIAGHSHHHRENTFTVRTPFGYQTFTLTEIGCLCSLERVKQKGSIQRMRTPSDRGFSTDWVNGLAVVEILEDTGQHRVEFIPIIEGRAIYHGQEFSAGKAAE